MEMFLAHHTWIQRGDRGSGSPMKNHKNIGFLSNIGPDPLKIRKLPSQHSMSGHYQSSSEMPFKWHFAGGPMMVRKYWHLDPPFPQKSCQSWTPSDKTSWIHACSPYFCFARACSNYAPVICIQGPHLQDSRGIAWLSFFIVAAVPGL